MVEKRNTAASATEATSTIAQAVLSAEQEREMKYATSILDGGQPHLQELYKHYVHNLLKHTERTSATAYHIATFFESVGLDVGRGKKFPSTPGTGNAAFYQAKDAAKKKVSEADWKIMTDHFGKSKKPVVIPDEDTVFKNLLRLADILGLNDSEKKPLGLLYVAQQDFDLGQLLSRVFANDLKRTSIGIARMLDTPLEGRKYATSLSYGARLNRYGMTYFEGGPDPENAIPAIDSEVLEKLDQSMDDDEIVAVLLGKPTKSQLGIEDFNHVGEQLDFVLNLVRNAVQNGEKGINVFLHGPAGSGKTELAAAIAKHLDLRLFSIGEPDQDDMTEEYTDSGAKRPASEVRVAKLLRTQALLNGSKNSLVLFDEIEDLLMKGTDSSKSADTDNKLEVNRLLETNPVVTIWTGNNPEKFHEAVRQRFTYSILMDYPPTLVREKVWSRRLQMENVTLPPEDVRTLAREYAAPARMISKAVRTMRIVGGDIGIIHASLEADSKIVSGQTDAILNDDCIPKDFSIDYLNGDKNLHEVFNRLVGRGVEKKPFSLLMKADPQTGAEHYLRSLAEEMVMNPYEVSFADLCAPHPMMPPEQKFRAAFEGSVDARQFLIVRGLEDLAGGGEGTLDWNNGLVDLFAHYALKHKLPFAIMAKPKTDLPKGIEMLFSDKVTMDAMKPEQVTALYQKTFGQVLPEDKASQLTGLSLEDFFKAKSFLTRLDNGGDGFDHGRAIDLLQRFKDRRRTPETKGIGFQAKI